MEFELSRPELNHFESEGWIGPFPLLDPQQAAELGPELRTWHEQSQHMPYPEAMPENGHFTERPWYQSLHAHDRRVYEIAAMPAILDRVAQLMGEDIVLWGSSFFGQAQGEAIHWHADLEYQCWDGVATWIALHDVSPENVLKLLPGSHRFPKTPENLMTELDLFYEDFQDDEQVLDFARQWKPDSAIERPAMKNGEFFLFRGNMWHGSDNPLEPYRGALNLRFSPPDQRVRIPVNVIPPAIFDPSPAPCLLMRGEDRFGLNPMISPPL